MEVKYVKVWIYCKLNYINGKNNYILWEWYNMECSNGAVLQIVTDCYRFVTLPIQ
jgi:hypothetical protein